MSGRAIENDTVLMVSWRCRFGHLCKIGVYILVVKPGVNLRDLGFSGHNSFVTQLRLMHTPSVTENPLKVFQIKSLSAVD